MFVTRTLEYNKTILAQGIEQGIEQGIKETALRMLRAESKLSFISEMTDIPEEKLLELKKQL